MKLRAPACPRPVLLGIATAASLLALTASLAACGQDEDPEGARALWEKIHAGAGFKAWPRAPGYATRKPSFTAHAREVDIYVSAEVAQALQGPARAWPLGSVIVKEGYSGDARKLVAVMEKRPEGWFWAEYDDDGKSLYSGRPSTCLDCHDNRATTSDWVYAFELPR